MAMAKKVGLIRAIPVKAWKPGRNPLELIRYDSRIKIDPINLASRIDREIVLNSKITL
jgi:hypothetical protein